MKFGRKPTHNVGDKVGELTLVEKLGKNQRGYTLYRCVCSCGREVVKSAQTLGRFRTFCGLREAHPNGERHEVNGEFLTAKELSVKYGVSKAMIEQHIRKGFTGEDIVKRRYNPKNTWVIGGKEYHSMQEIADVAGVSRERIRQRIKGGWKLEDLTLGRQTNNANRGVGRPKGSVGKPACYKTLTFRLLKFISENESGLDNEKYVQLKEELLDTVPSRYRKGEIMDFILGRKASNE